MDVNENLKEKLVDLLDQFVYDDWYGNGDIAEKLIANGVTVQEWISVKDRLPEPTYCVLVVGAYSEMAIDALGTDGEWMGMVEDITHWMPLPQPPKVV